MLLFATCAHGYKCLKLWKRCQSSYKRIWKKLYTIYVARKKSVCGAGISSEWSFDSNLKKKKRFYEPLIRVPSNSWLWNGFSFFSFLLPIFVFFCFCFYNVCIFPVNKATFLLITTTMCIRIEAVQMKQDKFVIYLCVDLWNDLHQCQLMTTFTTTMLIHFLFLFLSFRRFNFLCYFKCLVPFLNVFFSRSTNESTYSTNSFKL